ncbi:MAG: radical SAM protein [Gallionella sp.]|nr:radical SAM protein [Gallionella sp.]MDD4958679.1 radical SAM protein [Gallionella sp.]
MDNQDATSCGIKANKDSDVYNPFLRSRDMRKMLLIHVKIPPLLNFDGKGFICALVTSRCHIGCTHCMFFSNMTEGKNEFNTMTPARIDKLMQLVSDSNTGYLLVSGGGEGFIEPSLMYQIIETSTADIAWIVTSGFWAQKKSRAAEILRKSYQAFLRGNKSKPNRQVCLRISVDSYHASKLVIDPIYPFKYIINIIQIFESTYSTQTGFFLQLHCIEGEEKLIDQLRQQVNAVEVINVSSMHTNEKLTESAITLRMPSGFEFEITFAKLLLSDIAADLRDEKMLDRRIELWEKDAFVNERGMAAYQLNSNGSIGTDMLVVYDGRVAGGWQSEMPDISINIDVDSYETILNKTLSDPGVLATIEHGIAYRFEIINEVCPKASLRAKAVNIRDYTSLVLLEEDAVKLYYTLRAIQDFITEGRIEQQNMNTWPPALKTIINLSKEELRRLYQSSDYDIVKQFEETEPEFTDLIQEIRVYTRTGNFESIIQFLSQQAEKNLRRLDKWRLLMERISHDWYDIQSLDAKELLALMQVEQFIDSRLLQGRRVYEGLSRL